MVMCETQRDSLNLKSLPRLCHDCAKVLETLTDFVFYWPAASAAAVPPFLFPHHQQQQHHQVPHHHHQQQHQQYQQQYYHPQQQQQQQQPTPPPPYCYHQQPTPPPPYCYHHPQQQQQQQQREIAIFWDYENVPLAPWCDATVAAKAIVNAVSHYGRIVGRRLYFDFDRVNNIPYRPRDCAGLDSSGFDLVNTPTRNNKETLDKKLIADVLTFAWDSAARGGSTTTTGATGSSSSIIKPCVVLVTSDGDYAYTLSKLRDRGVYTIVMVGSVHTVSQILVNVADVALSLEGDVLLPEQHRLLHHQQQCQGMFVSSSVAATATTTLNGVSGLLYQELVSKGQHSRGIAHHPDVIGGNGIIAATSNGEALNGALKQDVAALDDSHLLLMLEFCRMIQERCALHKDGWATMSEMPLRQFNEQVLGRCSDPNSATGAMRAQMHRLRDEAVALGLVEVGCRRQATYKRRQVMLVKNFISVENWTGSVYVRLTPKAHRLLLGLNNTSSNSCGSITLENDNVLNHHNQQQHQDRHETITTIGSPADCKNAVKNHVVGDCKVESLALEEPREVNAVAVESDDENDINLVESQSMPLVREAESSSNTEPLDSCTEIIPRQQQQQYPFTSIQQNTTGPTLQQEDGSNYNNKYDDDKDFTVSKDEVQEEGSTVNNAASSNVLKLLLCSIIHQRVQNNRGKNSFDDKNVGWVDIGQTFSQLQDIIRRNKMRHNRQQVKLKARLASDEAVAEGLIEIQRLGRVSKTEISRTGSDSLGLGVLHVRLLSKGEELLMEAKEKQDKEFAEILTAISGTNVSTLPPENESSLAKIQTKLPGVLLQSGDNDSDVNKKTLDQKEDERLKSTGSEMPHVSNELQVVGEGSVAKRSVITNTFDASKIRNYEKSATSFAPSTMQWDSDNKGSATTCMASIVDTGTASSSEDKLEELTTVAIVPTSPDGRMLTRIPNGEDPSLVLPLRDKENQPIPTSSCSVLVCNLSSRSINIRGLVRFLEGYANVTTRRAQIELLPHSSSSACNAHVELIREVDAALLIEHAKNSMLAGGKGIQFQNRSIGIFPNTFTDWDNSEKVRDANSYYEKEPVIDEILDSEDDDTLSLCHALLHKEQHENETDDWINEAAAVHKFRSLLLHSKEGDPSVRYKIARANAISNGFIELGRLGAKKGLHDAVFHSCGNEILKPDDEPSLEAYLRLLPPGRLIVNQSPLATDVTTMPDVVFSDSNCVVM